jgi:hypothetical protein
METMSWHKRVNDVLAHPQYLVLSIRYQVASGPRRIGLKSLPIGP